MKYKKTAILVLVFLILIPPVIFSLSIIFPNENITDQVNPIFKKIENKIENPIGKIAREDLFEGEGEYGIYIKNLKTGEEYSYQANKKFDSASLYKLWVMAVAFEKIKDGSLDEEQELSAPLRKLDDTLSTSSLTPTPHEESQPKEEEKSVSMKTGDAIFKMITVSDNYAALLVASRAGNLNIANFIKREGYVNSNFKQPPETSAKDIAKFYEDLYDGKIVDREYSDIMIELLKKQALNDRIPKYLPEEIEVAHKTGELFGAKHDAGIVYSRKVDYIIVVLTDTDDQVAAAERIAKFSRGVFDYFEDQK